MKHRLKGLLALVLSLVMVLGMVVNASAETATYDYSDLQDGKTKVYAGDKIKVPDGSGGTQFALTDQKGGTKFISVGSAAVYNSSNEQIAELTCQGQYDESYTVPANEQGYEGYITHLGTFEDYYYKNGYEQYIQLGSLYLEPITTYPIWVQGVQVTSANASDVLGDGTVKYNHDTNVLVLKGANIVGDTSDGAAHKEGIYAEGGLSIALNGANTVTSDKGAAICVTGRLEIFDDAFTTGQGSLTATGTDYGIHASSSDGTVVINGGKVTAKAGANGTGICAGSTITIGGEHNPTVEVGCLIGLSAPTVDIKNSCTVNIQTTGTEGSKAIDCTNLKFGGNWYQWKGDDGQLNKSSDGEAYQLTKDRAASNKTLTIEKIPVSTGGWYPTYTEPEKVETPNTFDSGIALSVAVTILSVTGSAWLAKKKED